MSWETKTHIFEKRFKPFQKTIIEACAKVVGLLSGGKVTRSDYFLPHVSSLKTLMRILELTIWSTTAKLALLNSEKTLQLPGHTNLLKRRCELKFSNPSRSVPFKILKDSPRRLTFFITQLFLIITINKVCYSRVNPENQQSAISKPTTRIMNIFHFLPLTFVYLFATYYRGNRNK